MSPVFDFTTVQKNWLNHNLCLSHMFDVSSTGLPYIEGLVNYVAKSMLLQIQDEALLLAGYELIRQEANHAREHVKYNAMLKSHGYYFDDIIQQLKNKIARMKHKWSPLSLLAFATCFESFTTIISQIVLENNILQFADARMKQFWEWHMSEELEHKSVLMDMYRYFDGGYLRRISILTLVLAGYCYYGLKLYLRFLRHDNVSFWQGLKTACGKQSFFRQSLVKAVKCYSLGYHPSN